MELDIKILKDGAPVNGVTGMVVDGPASWPELAAISNEDGQLSFEVDAPGTYEVQLFMEDSTETISVKTGETVTFQL